MNLEILNFIITIVVINILLSLFKKKNNLAYCGLIGFSGEGTYDIMKIKFLMYWNSIERGTDATGFFTPDTGIIKDNSKAELFINTNTFHNKVKESNFVIAHVRAKTVGANTAVNAHPFRYGRIVGAHNGSLKNHWTLCTKYNLKLSEYDVDSQVLISTINKNFATENKFKSLGEYEGAAALLLYDNEEKVMYACHDKDRPLFYGYINDTEMYISSIKASLEVIGCTNVKEFPINTVHKIYNGQIIDTETYEKFVPPVPEKLKEAITEDIKKVNGKYIIPIGFKGVKFAHARGDMFVGFWVMINNLTNLSRNNFEWNKWYFCEEATLGHGKDYTRDTLKVYDDSWNLMPVRLTNIDCTNFIPVVNDFVALTYSVTKKNSKEVSGDVDDICRVLNYRYGDKTVHVLNLTNNEEFWVYVNSVRNLDYNERANALIEYSNFQTKLEFDKLVDIEQALVDSETPIDNYDVIEEDGVTEEDFEVFEKNADTEVQEVLLKTIESVDAAAMLIRLGNLKEATEELDETSDNLKQYFINS